MRRIKVNESLKYITLFIALGWIHPILAQTQKPIPVAAKGKIIHWESFKSKHVDARPVDIWLPEGYNGNSRYPVFYMHDGQMLFDSLITWNHQEWELDETLQQLFDAGKARPFIVVAIWNNGRFRNSEYLPEKVVASLPETMRSNFMAREMLNLVLADDYLSFIVNELKPAIDSAFHTLPDKSNTFIAGSSKGGLISLYAVCEYPAVFGGAACLSTHWIGSMTTGTEEFPEAMVGYLRKNLPPAGSHRFYLDHGTMNLDQHYQPHQRLADAVFREKGYGNNDFLSLEFSGADHTESAWASRFRIPVEFLMK